MKRFLFTFFFLLFFTENVFAFFGVELGKRGIRNEINQEGKTNSFLSSETSLTTHYQQNTRSNWTWGGSFQFSQLVLEDSLDSSRLGNETLTKSTLELYLSFAFRNGVFVQVGSRIASFPFFYIEKLDFTSSQVNRTEPFIKLGFFYNVNFGSGEMSFKRSFISDFNFKEYQFEGYSQQFYVNLFFGRKKHFGIYFESYNLALEGSFRSIEDSRAMGIIYRF
jgi:hypothetical protein